MTRVGCCVEDCEHVATEGQDSGQPLCDMHARRKRRGMPLIVPEVDPRRLLLEAALAYAEAGEDDEYAAAEVRLLRAARAYARSLTAAKEGSLPGLLDRLLVRRRRKLRA